MGHMNNEADSLYPLRPRDIGYKWPLIVVSGIHTTDLVIAFISQAKGIAAIFSCLLAIDLLARGVPARSHDNSF